MAKKASNEDNLPTDHAKVSLSVPTNQILDRISGRDDEDEEKQLTSREKAHNLVQALDEPNNTAKLKRLYPTKLRGRQLDNTMTIHCPANMNKVRERIENERGGKTWHLDVYDPDGIKIAGTTIDIEEPPKPVFLEEDWDEDEVPGFSGFRGGKPSWKFNSSDDDDDDEDDSLEENLNTMLKQEQKMHMIKQLRALMRDDKDEKKNDDSGLKDIFSQLKSDLKDMSRDHADAIKELDRRYNDQMKEITNKFTDALKDTNNKVDSQLKSIESMIRESKHDKELQALQAQLKEKDSLTALKSDLKEIQRNYERGLDKLASEMSGKGSKESDKMFLEMIRQMNNGNKEVMQALNSSIETRMQAFAKSGSDNKELFLELLREKKRDISDPFDGARGLLDIAKGITDLRGGNDEGPQSTQDRLIHAFENVAPQVLGYLEKRKEQGEKIGEEEIKEAIEKKSREIAKAAMEKVKSGAANIEGSEQKQLQAPSDDQQEENKEMNPEEQIKQRVNFVVGCLSDEIDTMAMEPDWIDHAIKYLPGVYLKQLAESEDPKTLLPILEKYADKGLMYKLGMKLMFSSEKRDWLERQLATLKRIIIEMHQPPQDGDANQQRPQVKSPSQYPPNQRPDPEPAPPIRQPSQYPPNQRLPHQPQDEVQAEMHDGLIDDDEPDFFDGDTVEDL